MIIIIRESSFHDLWFSLMETGTLCTDAAVVFGYSVIVLISVYNFPFLVLIEFFLTFSSFCICCMQIFPVNRLFYFPFT